MPIALMDWWMLADFIHDATRHPAQSWGLLLGRFAADAMRVQEVRSGTDVRETSPLALREFHDVIVPCFGPEYAKGGRGFWCDSTDVLRVTRYAESQGLEVLGSIHSHPGRPLSQDPTPMDEYLYRNTGWPLNLICYLERRDNEIFHTLGAWTAPSFVDFEARAEPITVRYTSTRRAQRKGAVTWDR